MFDVVQLVMFGHSVANGSVDVMLPMAPPSPPPRIELGDGTSSPLLDQLFANLWATAKKPFTYIGVALIVFSFYNGYKGHKVLGTIVLLIFGILFVTMPDFFLNWAAGLLSDVFG